MDGTGNRWVIDSKSVANRWFRSNPTSGRLRCTTLLSSSNATQERGVDRRVNGESVGNQWFGTKPSSRHPRMLQSGIQWLRIQSVTGFVDPRHQDAGPPIEAFEGDRRRCRESMGDLLQISRKSMV